MPQEEYEAFAKNILTDSTLQDKIDSVRLMLVGIQESSLSQKLEEFQKEIFSPEKKTSHSTGKIVAMKRWLVAASVIVIAGLGTMLFLNKSNQPERLFSEFYKPDPGLITAMGASENYLFEHAMIDYKTKNYDSAIKSWKELLKSNSSSDTLNYFIGSAFLAKEKSDSAIYYFQKVVSNPASYFFNDANWYLGLALVKQQKSREAIPYIEQSNHQNKEAVLQKLKK